MKARNNKQIVHGYIKFAIGFITGTMIGVGTVFCFVQTNEYEYNNMEAKNQEYDRVYAGQLALVEKIDSLYSYLSLLGSEEHINQVMMQKVVSTRKMQLIEELGKPDTKDVLLYSKLASQINEFLEVKEAIRKAGIEENLVRNDLMRCVQDNKQAARKLTLGAGKADE